MTGDDPTGAPAGDFDPELADGLVSFARLGGDLVDGVLAALPHWVVACVERRAADAGAPVTDELRAAAAVAGEAAVADVAPRLRELVAADPEDQRANPLAVIRPAARFPTSVLRAAGVPAVARDEQARAQFPDDDYDLVPASFGDLDPALTEIGLAWGAAKAWIHLRRRRSSSGP